MRGCVMPARTTSDDSLPIEPTIEPVRRADEIDGDQHTTSDDPFAAMPDARRVVLTFLIGLAVIVAALTGAGLLITDDGGTRGGTRLGQLDQCRHGRQSKHGRHRPGTTHHEDR